MRSFKVGDQVEIMGVNGVMTITELYTKQHFLQYERVLPYTPLKEGDNLIRRTIPIRAVVLHRSIEELRREKIASILATCLKKE